MSAKPETQFRARIRPHLDAIENSWWESIQQKAIHGTPDILGCVNGWFVALELKASSREKPSPIQEYKLNLISKAGGMSVVVNPENWPQVHEMLISLAKGKK